MTFDSFVKRYIGKAVDYDGVAGVQCVDLVKLYLYNVFGIRAGAWGNARDYWLDFSSHPTMTANFIKIKNTPSFIPKKGDIVVLAEIFQPKIITAILQLQQGREILIHFILTIQIGIKKKCKR